LTGAYILWDSHLRESPTVNKGTFVVVELRTDGRQSETASAVQRGVCRLLRQAGFATLPEFTLASGRRADVIAVSAAGLIWIVEIKSSLADFRSDSKWMEYRDFCDRLFFAIPDDLDPEIMPADAGLIVADMFGAEILRDAPETPLHAARRRALTLAFGRSAAQRLHALYDPVIETIV
jgi:hypothetical protein